MTARNMSHVSVQMSPVARRNDASEDLLSDTSAEKRVNVLRRPLRPLHFVLGLAGLWPYWCDKATSEYKLSWLSAQGVHTMLTFSYISVLLVTTAFGVVRLVVLQQTDAAEAPADPKKQTIKIIGVVMVVGYLINAWVQLLNTISAGRRLCRLLNRWNQFHGATFIDPTKGLYVKSCMKVVYMVAFIVTMLVLTVIGVPEFLLDVLDGLAEHIFLVPSAWLIRRGVFTKVVHTTVCAAALHQFIVNKGTVFAFTTSCHLLRKGFGTWNNHLQETLEGIWKRCPQDRFGQMVQSRYQLVTLVKETEQVFSPVLQCYFATTIVVICTELYLLAQRLGSGHYDADEVIVLILLTVQTTSLFVMVSLAAGAVQDEAGVGGEILRRGLPFCASDKDKYHAWELTRSLSITPVYITGGNFFTINRAFILTVVSAVASYFIVILQFMNTCQEDAKYNTSHVG